MKRNKLQSIIALIFMSLFLFISCNKDDNYSEILVVASKRIITESEGHPYWIKKQGSNTWEIMHSTIQNFNYEEGYEYIIEVEVTKTKSPGPDESEKQYVLLRIISKEKKDSEVPLFTTSLSLCGNQTEIAFPNKEKENVTLPNGINLEKIDSLYIFQGDIVLNENQINSIFGNNVQTRSGVITASIKYWTGHRVYYTFKDNFTLQSNVLAAIAEWSNKTSLTFIQGKGSGNYIEFFHGNGNYSNSLGRKGGKQTISLAINGSNIGSAIHEIGHAVGLIHEQCRNDRDNYVTVHWDNIDNNYKSQFNIYPLGQTTDIGNFDFTSVMLYGSTAFSKNGSYTMTTKEGYFFDGQRSYLSAGDVEGVKSIYGPPFQKLSTHIDVTREEVYGLQDIVEYDKSNIIYFYSDKECKQRTTLTYPRYITITIETRKCNQYGEKVQITRKDKQILVPAGADSYNLGDVHNIEWYTMSNPNLIDITDYIVPE